MAWMKYNACYKHGNGQTEWIDIGSGSCSSDEARHFFEEYDREHGDPEGFRTGKYEVFDLPPAAVLEREIKSLAQRIEANQAYLLKLHEMLASVKPVYTESKA